MSHQHSIPLRIFVTLIAASVFVTGCGTGSNYEKLKAAMPPTAAETASIAVPSRTYVIRPFTFAEIGNRSEMFRKAFVVPGYKGIDFDTYGRMDPADQKAGMKTIYSLPEVHVLIGQELTKLDIKTIIADDLMPDDSEVLSIHVLGSESSLRMNTYGCWPVVGAVVYLFNADIYSVVTRTRLEYTLTGSAKGLRKGSLDIYSEKDFSFWGSYMGFTLFESFDEAQAAHLKDIAAQLARVLSL